jgi:hypothetical protein
VEKGLKTIEDAAQSIVDNMPSSFDSVDDAMRNWFLLDIMLTIVIKLLIFKYFLINPPSNKKNPSSIYLQS